MVMGSNSYFESFSPGFMASQNSHMSSIKFICSGVSGKFRPTLLSTSGLAITAKINCWLGGGGGGGVGKMLSSPMPKQQFDNDHIIFV
jgi:hypothetical protein